MEVGRCVSLDDTSALVDHAMYDAFSGRIYFMSIDALVSFWRAIEGVVNGVGYFMPYVVVGILAWCEVDVTSLYRGFCMEPGWKGGMVRGAQTRGVHAIGGSHLCGYLPEVLGAFRGHALHGRRLCFGMGLHRCQE